MPLETDEIEVGGVKIKQWTDKSGHVWAVPADDDNIDLREFRNQLEIPKRDPDLYYQFVEKSRVDEFQSAGYVLVTRDEVGFQPMIDSSAQPLMNNTTSYHHVGDLYLVKIPKIIEQRRRKIQKMRADEAKAAISVPRQLGKSIGERGVEIVNRETEVTMGPVTVTPASEFKTFEDEE